MTTCFDITSKNLVVVNIKKGYVNVHIKDQPSTRMHGFLTAATASLLGSPSHTWFIQPLDELPLYKIISPDGV